MHHLEPAVLWWRGEDGYKGKIREGERRSRNCRFRPGPDLTYHARSRAEAPRVTFRPAFDRLHRAYGVRVGPGQSGRESAQAWVSFTEAATVLGDSLGTTAPDPDHSGDEHRYITVGLSNRGRLLMVAHVERRQRIRIISARELTRNERQVYEETQR